MAYCSLCNVVDVDDFEVENRETHHSVLNSDYKLELDRQCFTGGLANLVLHNSAGSKLSQRAFYIGSSEKQSSSVQGVVGRFGEGLNLSLSALWRARARVKIQSDGETWNVSEYDGQLWVEAPDDDGAFPIGAVQYAAHTMGCKEAVRELVSNWLDECRMRGSSGTARCTQAEPDHFKWSTGKYGSLTWTGREVEMPGDGVVFLIENLPVEAFDPRAFLKLVPATQEVDNEEHALEGWPRGSLLLDDQHMGMVFVHGVRFDALTNPVPRHEGATASTFANGSGFGYALEDKRVHIPRDRDAVQEEKLTPHIASVLFYAARDTRVLRILYRLLKNYPDGFEARMLQRVMLQVQGGERVYTDLFSDDLMTLGSAVYAEFRRLHGPTAFAVDRPLQSMDLDGMRMTGLEAVDMSACRVLTRLMVVFGGHPALEAAIASARASAEKVAVDVDLAPAVRRSVDAAAAELGRSAGVGVYVRAVDGPPSLVKRHVKAGAGSWQATIHWELLDPSAIHQRLGGCPARNREGQCSCAFVATVKEVLAGAKDARVVGPQTEQMLLWNMLALGATGGGNSDSQATPPAPQQRPKEQNGENGTARRPPNAMEKALGALTGVGLKGHALEPGPNYLNTIDPGDVVGPSVKHQDAPTNVQDRCIGDMTGPLVRSQKSKRSPVGIYVEEGPSAKQWMKQHPRLLAALQKVIRAIVKSCGIQGSGVHIYIPNVYNGNNGFNREGSIFISARSFADFPENTIETADRVFGLIKHELAHNQVVDHNMRFIEETEAISMQLDPEWYFSSEREALESEVDSGSACPTQ